MYLQTDGRCRTIAEDSAVRSEMSHSFCCLRSEGDGEEDEEDMLPIRSELAVMLRREGG